MITSAEDLVIVVSPPLLAMVAAIVLCNGAERVFEILLVLLALSVLQIYAIKANGSRVREEDKAAQKEERREREE